MIKLFLVLKLFYLLLPKFVRSQYDDSFRYYKEIVLRILQKYKNTKNTKSVINENLRLELVNNIEDLGCSYEVIFEKKNRDNYIRSPKLYLEGKSYFKPELQGSLPDIHIYILKKVSVVGSTDAIIYKDNFLHHELNLMESWHDLKRRDIFTKIDEEKYKLNLKYNKKQLYSKENKKYISLLKEHSVNYYHFMIEGLPRLIQLVEVLKPKSGQFDTNEYVLLVDDEMPKQCLEAINLVLNDTIKIVFVKKGERYFCDELYYCTPLWTSIDNTTALPSPKKEFFVDKYAINLVREKILSSFIPKVKTVDKIRKVYLQRLNNKLRPINNISQLEACMFKNDFEFMDIGSLNLKEQIELFQTVDVVVGVSGAAFTNLIFMKENAKAINFYPSVSATNYYLFQPLADISHVDLMHFLTTSQEGQISIHSEASIDIDSLNLLLKELNEI